MSALSNSTFGENKEVSHAAQPRHTEAYEPTIPIGRLSEKGKLHIIIMLKDLSLDSMLTALPITGFRYYEYG